MAYLHCHSCDWSQDDFWCRSYNPITKFWSDIKWLIRPQLMDLDEGIVNDLTKYTHVPIFRFRARRRRIIDVKIHTWNWLLLEFVKEIRITLAQRWWTTEAWNRSKKTARCPGCGDRNFDID